MELFYLLYLNGVVRILLSYQSPALVSCDINQHCTAHFLSSCIVVVVAVAVAVPVAAVVVAVVVVVEAEGEQWITLNFLHAGPKRHPDRFAKKMSTFELL